MEKSKSKIVMYIIILLTFASCKSEKSKNVIVDSDKTENTNTINDQKPPLKTFEITKPIKLNDLNLEVSGETDLEKTLTTFVKYDKDNFYGSPFDSLYGITPSIEPLIFDYLAIVSPDGKINKSLLEEYYFENKSLVLKLKPDLKWCNGKELISKDLLSNIYCLYGRSEIWDYIKSIEEIDDLTLKLELTTDNEMFLKQLFSYPLTTQDEYFLYYALQFKEIINNHRIYDEKLNSFSLTDQGKELYTTANNLLLSYKPTLEDTYFSGPYIITEWNENQIKFKKSKSFRNDSAFNNIIGIRTDNEEDLANLIKNNEFSLESGVLSNSIQKDIEKKFENSLREIFIPSYTLKGFKFNMEKYPFNIPELRKAINMYIDDEKILGFTNNYYAELDHFQSGILPSLQKNYDLDSLKNYNYNQEGAENLLYSIGWKKENNLWIDKDGNDIKINISVKDDDIVFINSAMQLKEQLNNSGFLTEFKIIEYKNWNTFLNSNEKMIYSSIISSADKYFDIYESLTTFWIDNEAMFPDENSQIIIKNSVNNKEVNVSDLLNKLYETKDSDVKNKIITELLITANDLCSYIPISEQATPIRIYDKNLSLKNAENFNIQKNDFYYNGDLNKIIAKLLLDKNIEFIK